MVAEPGDGVLTSEDGAEQCEVVSAEGIESGGVTAVVGSGSAQGIERGDAVAVRGGGGERVEVATVRCGSDLEVPPGVRDAFAHLAPPPLPTLGCVQDPEDTELARIVDRGLDS